MGAPAFLWQTFFDPTSFSPSHVPLYQGIVAVAALMTLAGFYFRLRPTYLVYATLSMLFYLSWSSLEALPRYMCILLPVHIALALVSMRWKWSYEPLLAFSVVLLALCTVLFANGYQMT